MHNQSLFSALAVLVNSGLIVVLIGLGTFVLHFAQQLAGLVQLDGSMIGLLVGGIVLVLCVPPAALVWRGLRGLTNEVAEYVLSRRTRSSRIWSIRNLGEVLRNSFLVLLATLLLVWSFPFLISIAIPRGPFSHPVYLTGSDGSSLDGAVRLQDPLDPGGGIPTHLPGGEQPR